MVLVYCFSRGGKVVVFVGLKVNVWEFIFKYFVKEEIDYRQGGKVICGIIFLNFFLKMDKGFRNELKIVDGLKE